ncbi:MAG: hypothetical protein ACI8ZB_004297 [Desulforhopalus sp.]|jgi:hypothetical protein
MYPEISYRKFCKKEYLGLERKQNRVFIGLPQNWQMIATPPWVLWKSKEERYAFITTLIVIAARVGISGSN